MPFGSSFGLPFGLPFGFPFMFPFGFPFGFPSGLLFGLPFGLPFGFPLGLSCSLAPPSEGTLCRQFLGGTGLVACASCRSEKSAGRSVVGRVGGGGRAQSSFSVVCAGRASRPGCPGLAASGPRKRRACCASGKGLQRSIKKQVPELRRSGLAVVIIWITDCTISSPWQLLIRY